VSWSEVWRRGRSEVGERVERSRRREGQKG
jgi:hypothetical protein